MALPQDGQNANGLTKVTEIPKGKELIFIDPTTNEGGIITLEDLTTQILKNLTSQTFALDQGTKTLLAALNELNSKAVGAFKAVGFADRSTITIKTNGESYSYGMLIVAINQNGSNSLLNFNITPSINQTIGQVSVIAKDSTTFIVTFPNVYTHGVIIAGGTISKATFTVS